MTQRPGLVMARPTLDGLTCSDSTVPRAACAACVSLPPAARTWYLPWWCSSAARAMATSALPPSPHPSRAATGPLCPVRHRNSIWTQRWNADHTGLCVPRIIREAIRTASTALCHRSEQWPVGCRIVNTSRCAEHLQVGQQAPRCWLSLCQGSCRRLRGRRLLRCPAAAHIPLPRLPLIMADILSKPPAVHGVAAPAIWESPASSALMLIMHVAAFRSLAHNDVHLFAWAPPCWTQGRSAGRCHRNAAGTLTAAPPAHPAPSTGLPPDRRPCPSP